MLQAIDTKRTKEFEYATAADFCRIFAQDLKSLFLLALLLTGDHEKAEQCFATALENATNRRTVFREWARPWARRAIIQSALEMINPRPRRAEEVPISVVKEESGQPMEIATVLSLAPFERFVFVMSVLEGYSHHTCVILLGAMRREVIEAQTRALSQLGRKVESGLSSDDVSGGTTGLVDEKPALDLQAFARSA